MQLTPVGNRFTLTLQVRNANGGTIKGVGASGCLFNNSALTLAVGGEGAYAGGGALSGFRLFFTGGSNISGGTVRVYGHRNT
jgi:hypothetical protein